MKQKMTDRDKADAYFMRLNGFSLQEIADQFGVSKQYIAQMFPASGRAAQHMRNPERCIYPSIRKYMKQNRMTYSRLAALCGCSPTSLYRNLTGEAEITKRTIDKLLEVTQMTYEQAFWGGGTHE